MKRFVKKRLLLFKKQKIRGEILSNIGLGLFVNALYSLTQKEIKIYILFDIIFAIMLILEGVIMKEENEWK